MVLAGGSSGNVLYYDVGKETVLRVIHAHDGE